MMSTPETVFYPQTCDASFHCEQCGQTTPAVFRDPDLFAADEPIEGRNRALREAALEKAQKGLVGRANRALRLLPCPRCQARPRHARLWACYRAALPLVGVIPVTLPTLTMLFGVWFGLSPWGCFGLSVGVVSLLSLTVIVWGQKRHFAEAQKSTTFSPA